MSQTPNVGRRAAIKLSLSAAALLLTGLHLPATGAAADGPGELIVTPAAGATATQINARFGTRSVLQLTGNNQQLVWSPSVEATLAAMRATPALVSKVESNSTAKPPRAKDDGGGDGACPPPATSSPTWTTTLPTGLVGAKDDGGGDPYCTSVVADGAAKYQSQWAVDKVRLGALPTTALGRGVVIAVLDTRIDASHPALAGRTLPPVDLVFLSPMVGAPTQGRDAGHGTFVAGIALRAAPDAEILPIRVLNEDGVGSVALIAESIRRAVAMGAQVINMSLSTDSDTAVLKDAVEVAKKAKVILIAAYGNDGLAKLHVYPADYDGVVSVAATDQLDRRAGFSNWGKPADVGAPGVDIVAPYLDGQYGMGNGTSYSTPWIAGTMASLLSVNRNPDEVMNTVVARADDIRTANFGEDVGFRRLNVQRVVEEKAYQTSIAR